MISGRENFTPNFTPKPLQPAWPRRDTKAARLFWLTLLACGLAAIEVGIWLVRGLLHG